jgi:REP element-mobilizing transposase RayT
LKTEGGIYFVTFRLADSLPRETVARLAERHVEMQYRARATNLALLSNASTARQAQEAAEIEALLDRGSGAAWLRKPELAETVAQTLRHFEGERYHLHAWVVMPNHVHVVVEPSGRQSLGEILHSWKSYTAQAANRQLGRQGTFWQRESYDHLVRDAKDLAGCCEYTEQNPVKADLCHAAHDWPWSSAYLRPKTP